MLIYSKTESDHITHVHSVLSNLASENLRVKLSERTFAQDSTTFLSYRVSAQGLRVDPKNVSAVSNWPLSHDITSTRSFLHFTASYRRFIPNYATLAAPLTDLTKPPSLSLTPFPGLPSTPSAARQTNRKGYRKPPELAEGGNKGSSGTEENHKRQEERLKGPRAQAAGGSLAPRPQTSSQITARRSTRALKRVKR